MARRSDTYVGNESLTSPEGRTVSDMRRVRTDRDRIMSPSTGWRIVVFIRYFKIMNFMSAFSSSALSCPSTPIDI